MVEMVDVRLRKLQIDERYERSDKIMATLAGSEGPTRITMCSGNDLPGNNLGGFQLFYGKYNPQAGPAHGNIKGDCTEHSLYDKVIQINFWIWAPEEYAGMEIVMTDYNDASATPKSITAGVTGDLTAARRQTLDFTSFDFFGFETKMDKTDRITNIDVVTYDADVFYKWKSEAEAGARTGRSGNEWYDWRENMASEADSWYTIYKNEIGKLRRNAVLANLPIAKATDTYVLRVEEVNEIQAQVCEYIDLFGGNSEEDAGCVSIGYTKSGYVPNAALKEKNAAINAQNAVTSAVNAANAQASKAGDLGSSLTP